MEDDLESPVFYLSYLRLLELLVFPPPKPEAQGRVALPASGCLPALPGVVWCRDQGAGVGRVCMRYTEAVIQINEVEKFNNLSTVVQPHCLNWLL